MVTMNWYYVNKSTRAERILTNVMKGWSGYTMNAGWPPYNSRGELIPTLLFQPSGVVFTTTSAGIVLGTGTTPPTIHDYRLESQITSGLTSQVSTLVDEDNNRIYKITLISTSEDPITIGEIGIMGGFYASERSGYNYALIERTVLDEPVTIPAGEIGIVEYTIRMQMPEA